VLAALGKGSLKSEASKAELAELKAAALATAVTKLAQPSEQRLAAVSQAVAYRATKVSQNRL
jgi:hypothetical protein